MPATIRITEASTRAEITEAIAALRARQQRMPAHWTDRREALSDEVDALVDQWLRAE